MKIEKKTVIKITLSELDALDPIAILIEDTAPNQGKIIIECFSESWSACWNAMGGNITDFFCSCDEDYLAGNLSSIKSKIIDVEAINILAEQNDLQPEDNPSSTLLIALYGEEFWYDTPYKDNPKYIYLCRIINAVQDALQIIKERQ